ncbi:uncharacterized protein A4U43_C05F4450 [Asparagus officinalis]|uniref:RING-type domain-containing protein n=2 Tax=Asparagus officinalis TaxID=4686 RepID=A0A5P1EPB3_ASPOF|nr:uncharacterized protein A4U43_C05F4450 [Asparagus officinalis]
MSDDGDRTCPLCAEEMDLTDQQLKPCKCGYEICVWCWHHIMEMAEKEGSDGRCPACRTTYDKQRIVGMSANCKRMVAEISAEKKQKPQKAKNKSSSAIEDRKHLSSVRVVQRNLVYIMGMPSNLADESVLERKEYFGQYGKVLKVSVSRQAGTTPQQVASNNTFNVYITYAREEEAVRCIQATHNFVLEGKPLRACFGTTKYCYTWLRNMTCSNPDCLYLHDIGSHEDSFTKDEIISAYTRSRVPQIPSTILLPRAGNVLPPPIDDLYSNGAFSTRPSTKPFNSTANQVKSAPIDISGTRSTVLPAAASWGLRASNSRSPSSNIASSQNPLSQKIEVLNNSSSSSMLLSTKQNSAWNDNSVIASKIPEGRHAVHINGRYSVSEPLKHGSERDHLIKVVDESSGTTLDVDHSSDSAWDDDITTVKLPDGKHTMHTTGRFRNTITVRCTNAAFVSDTPEVILDEPRHSAWDDDTDLTLNMTEERQIVDNDDRFRSTGTQEPSIAVFRASTTDVTSETFPDVVHTSGVSISCSSGQCSPQHENHDTGGTASLPSSYSENTTYSKDCSYELSRSCADKLSHVSADNGNIESLSLGLSSVNLDTCPGIDHINAGQQQSSVSDDRFVGKFGHLNSRQHQHQHHPENGVESLSTASVFPNVQATGNLSDWRTDQQKQALSSSGNGLVDALAASADQRHGLSELTNLPSCSPSVPNHLISSSHNCSVGDGLFSVGDSRTMGRRVNSESLFCNGNKDQMSSNFVKIDGANDPDGSYIGKELGSSDFGKISNMERSTTVNTEEENIVSKILSLDFDPWDNSWSSANDFAKLLARMNKQEGPAKQSQSANQSRFSFARQENQANIANSSYRDMGFAHQQVSSKQEAYGNCFGNDYPVSSFGPANSLGNSSSTISSDTNAGVTKLKISAPPGFSVPNRAPPPGFSSQDRYDQTINTFSESQLIGSPLQDQFQAHSTNNAVDVEFIDPAILAVGKGRLPLGINNAGIGSRSSYHQQFTTSESDARIQLLMQQSISASHGPRIPNHISDRFVPHDDAYTASRFSAQNPSLSPFSQISHQQPSCLLNNQWNGWNDMQIGNGIGIPEVLRGERFGVGNYFPINEEPKFHLPSSGDIYNRAFGI